MVTLSGGAVASAADDGDSPSPRQRVSLRRPPPPALPFSSASAARVVTATASSRLSHENSASRRSPSATRPRPDARPPPSPQSKAPRTTTALPLRPIGPSATSRPSAGGDGQPSTEAAGSPALLDVTNRGGFGGPPRAARCVSGAALEITFARLAAPKASGGGDVPPHPARPHRPPSATRVPRQSVVPSGKEDAIDSDAIGRGGPRAPVPSPVLAAKTIQLQLKLDIQREALLLKQEEAKLQAVVRRHGAHSPSSTAASPFHGGERPPAAHGLPLASQADVHDGRGCSPGQCPQMRDHTAPGTTTRRDMTALAARLPTVPSTSTSIAADLSICPSSIDMTTASCPASVERTSATGGSTRSVSVADRMLQRDRERREARSRIRAHRDAAAAEKLEAEIARTLQTERHVLDERKRLDAQRRARAAMVAEQEKQQLVLESTSLVGRRRLLLKYYGFAPWRAHVLEQRRRFDLHVVVQGCFGDWARWSHRRASWRLCRAVLRHVSLIRYVRRGVLGAVFCHWRKVTDSEGRHGIVVADSFYRSHKMRAWYHKLSRRRVARLEAMRSWQLVADATSAAHATERQRRQVIRLWHAKWQRRVESRLRAQVRARLLAAAGRR